MLVTGQKKYSASLLSGGREICSKVTELSPPMGSGHFPEEGYRKSAYIRQIKVVTDRSQDYVDPEDDDLKMYIDKPYCYNARHDVGQAA